MEDYLIWDFRSCACGVGLHSWLGSRNVPGHAVRLGMQDLPHAAK